MALSPVHGAALAAALFISACGSDNPQTAGDADLNIDVCEIVTPADLDIIAAARRDKVAYADSMGRANRCMWAEREDGMAYFDITIAVSGRDIRADFPEAFPDHVELVEIRDLGDAGYMTVTEGRIGNLAIRRGNRVLSSAAVFLDIEPGSEAHDRLWDIYRRVLD
ncbi:MAG: hypothetical protein ACK4MQ_02030 [Hyphomonas sp.]